MDTIIGLGAAGCRIAQQFSQFPQYDIKKIDVGISGPNCFSLQQKATPEEYEASVPDMSQFFADIDGEILFIVGGGGKISGAALRILQQLQNYKVNILYVKPYNKSLTKTGLLQDKVAFNVLQEYTRSGLLHRMFLVHNVVLENLVGEVPILEYNDRLNNLIVSAFHYINVFNNTDPVLENSEPPKDIQRITTIGIYDIKNSSETPFYPIQNVGHKCYYYAVPEQVLKTDGKLFKMIKEKAAENQSSYRVHTTKHGETFAYFIANSSFIQSVDSAS